MDQIYEEDPFDVKQVRKARIAAKKKATVKCAPATKSKANNTVQPKKTNKPKVATTKVAVKTDVVGEKVEAVVKPAGPEDSCTGVVRVRYVHVVRMEYRGQVNMFVYIYVMCTHVMRRSLVAVFVDM